MVQAEIEESGGINAHIPEKIYKVRLAGIRMKTLKDVEKKDRQGKTVMGTDNKPILEDVDRWEWVFGLRVEEGKQESDIKFTHLTSPKISTKSNAFSFAKALTGKAPEVGKSFDSDDIIGLYADAVVKDKKPRTDQTGNIVLSSGITELSPSSQNLSPEIVIEGLADDDEPGDEAADTAAAAALAAKQAADAAALLATQKPAKKQKK